MTMTALKLGKKVYQHKSKPYSFLPAARWCISVCLHCQSWRGATARTRRRRRPPSPCSGRGSRARPGHRPPPRPEFNLFCFFVGNVGKVIVKFAMTRHPLSFGDQLPMALSVVSTRSSRARICTRVKLSCFPLKKFGPSSNLCFRPRNQFPSTSSTSDEHGGRKLLLFLVLLRTGIRGALLRSVSSRHGKLQNRQLFTADLACENASLISLSY